MSTIPAKYHRKIRAFSSEAVTKKLRLHNMYYETEASKGSGVSRKYFFKEDIIMSCFNFGGNNCCWIIILILLFCVCGNGGNANNNDCGNSCNPCC